MPTPPLAVLHALLEALNLQGLDPPTLQSTPPTLLLLILDHLNGRLPLPIRLRRPRTTDDEISLTKCILGVLTSVLSMDLSVVDPPRLVAGNEADLAVVVVALAVAARRSGIRLDLHDEEWDNEWTDSIGEESLMDMEEDFLPDRRPLEPLPIEAFVTPPKHPKVKTPRDQLEEYAFDPLSPGPSVEALSSTEERRKTVLQSMIEEFGLEPV